MNLKRLRIIFSLVMGLLIILCVWTYWNLNNYIKTVGNIRQVNLTIQTTTQILSLIKDAETGHRGYLLTQDESYLEPFYQADVSISSELATLDSLATHIPEIRSDVDRLDTLTRIQLNTIYNILKANNWKNSTLEAEEVGLLQEGKKNMDEIREVGDKIIQSSRKLFLVAIEDEGGFKTVTPINMLVIALIAFGGILLLFTRAVMLLDERDKESKTLETAVQNLKDETEK